MALPLVKRFTTADSCVFFLLHLSQRSQSFVVFAPSGSTILSFGGTVLKTCEHGTPIRGRVRLLQYSYILQYCKCNEH